MKIVEPGAEFIKQETLTTHMINCCKIISGDENGYPDLDQKLQLGLIDHFTYYAIVDNFSKYSCLQKFIDAATNDVSSGIKVMSLDDKLLLVLPGLFTSKHSEILEQLSNYNLLVTPDEFSNELNYVHRLEKYFIKRWMRCTFKITTQIKTSLDFLGYFDEFTKIDVCSNPDKAICRPYWITKEDGYRYMTGELGSILSESVLSYLWSCENSFEEYHKMVSKGFFRDELAAGILPSDTAITILSTCSVDMYKKFIHNNTNPNLDPIVQEIVDKLTELDYWEYRS